MDDRILWLWFREGRQPDMTAIKAAKAQLDLPYLVKARVATPATEQRVLALGDVPAFGCDYYLVHPNASASELRAAIAWTLSEVDYDPRATTVVDTVRSVLGDGFREISPDELIDEQKLRDYQAGR
jgi:hypothetical protein